jgi:ubiquitin carboxyl-terminal hydrolase 10
MPVPFRAPQLEPSTPSIPAQQIGSPTLSHTQTAASLTTPPIQPMHMQPRKSAIDEAPSASPTPQITSLQAKQAPFHPIVGVMPCRELSSHLTFEQLPWCSVEESLFPPRIAHRRRKRVVITADQVELPLRQQSKPPVEQLEVAAADSGVAMTAGPESIVPQDIQQIARAEQPDPVTPSTSAPPSEVNSTNPTTPSSSTTTATIAPTSQTHKRTTTKGAIIPIVPIKPVLPLKPLSPAQPRPATKKPLTPAASIETTANIVKAVVDEAKDADPTETDSIKPNEIDTSNDVNSATEETPTKAAPSSWAALFASRQAALAANAASATATTNASITNGVSKPKANTMAEALHLYKVENEEKIPFLEPRGLVNTGNMCYMNSVGLAICGRWAPN